jgi:thymidylate synthase
MKIVVLRWIRIVFAVVLCAIAGQSQSLPPGGYSGGPGKNYPRDPKEAPRVYDNDNLPSAATLSVVGTSTKETGKDSDNFGNNEAQGTTTRGSDIGNNSNRQNKKPGEIKPGQSPSERQQAYAEWGKRIRDERKNVNQLAWELDDLKHNPPMSVAVFHLWPDDQLYLESIAEKQKALDRARAALSDLEDQARRAGVPSSFTGGDGNGAARESPEDGRKTYANVVLQQQVRKAGTSSHENEADEDGKSAAQNTDTPHSSINDDPNQNDKSKGEIKPGQSPDERQKAYVYWQKRVQQREDRIDQLTRELDDLKKNAPTAVIMHLWPEDQIYLQIVADKQKALGQAQGDLSDLQEQARKSGVPSSFRQER